MRIVPNQSLIQLHSKYGLTKLLFSCNFIISPQIPQCVFTTLSIFISHWIIFLWNPLISAKLYVGIISFRLSLFLCWILGTVLVSVLLKLPPSFHCIGAVSWSGIEPKNIITFFMPFYIGLHFTFDVFFPWFLSLFQLDWVPGLQACGLSHVS